MRPSAVRVVDRIERVQTGVRMEKRIVKVLNAVAEFYDLSLGELLENLVLSTFAGRNLFSDPALALVGWRASTDWATPSAALPCSALRRRRRSNATR